MFRVAIMTLVCTVILGGIPRAEARKNPGNPLPAPILVDADILAAGESECDGDDVTTDDVCVRVIFTKVCAATEYSVDLSKGFDTGDDGCNDTNVGDDEGVAAEACTGTPNCLEGSAECQTADVAIGTTTFCVDDGDLTVDCVNDPEDVEVAYQSLCAKVKAKNPPQKGPKAVSQSTPFSNTICPDINDECI